MKKNVLGVVLAGCLLLFPVVASALSILPNGTTKIGSEDLLISVTPGVIGAGYYTDYQGKVINSGEMVELFCVEKQDADLYSYRTYDLYRLADIKATVTDEIKKLFIQVTWVAENYWDAPAQEKGQAQLAIWDLLDTIGTNPIATSGLASQILAEINNADALVDYTRNWMLAKNSSAQDYLMRTDPVPNPEPATMLLLGTGLIGLAGASRKKFKK